LGFVFFWVALGGIATAVLSGGGCLILDLTHLALAFAVIAHARDFIKDLVSKSHRI
jgi:hypothetical protein